MEGGLKFGVRKFFEVGFAFINDQGIFKG
jgi:hypothetical protein